MNDFKIDAFYDQFSREVFSFVSTGIVKFNKVYLTFENPYRYKYAMSLSPSFQYAPR